MIEEIIENEKVDIHFQPIVSIRTKEIYAFEALTRCNFNKQYIPPDILFNLAKEKNLNIELDAMTRNKAIRKFHKYYLENPNLILFLNFESDLINNFTRSSKLNSFIEIIVELNIPFKNFVLEIKEDEISNINALKEFCKAYKELGFSIALDDFGTGSSNFHRIDIIRPDLIKIDKSLFVDLKNNLINKEVVKAIAKMSHNLGISVLNEGVEDTDSICMGLRSSIDLFQGYYFSKPKDEFSKSDFEDIIQKSTFIGKEFKSNTIFQILKKREYIGNYETIANEIIDKITNINQSFKILKKEFEKFDEIEAMYLIDCKDSKQVNDTIINMDEHTIFRPSKQGDEHYLKEYFYITLESKQGSFLSQKYISYASGNICKTFAKKFDFNKSQSYILCLDLVVEGKFE